MFFWVGVIMIGLSLAVLVNAVRVKADQKGIGLLQGKVRWTKIFSVLAALFLYAYAFTFLGFILSTVPLLIFSLRLSSPEMGLGFSRSGPQHPDCLRVFQLWLGSQLPRGFLG